MDAYKEEPPGREPVDQARETIMRRLSQNFSGRMQAAHLAKCTMAGRLKSAQKEKTKKALYTGLTKEQTKEIQVNDIVARLEEEQELSIG